MQRPWRHRIAVEASLDGVTFLSCHQRAVSALVTHGKKAAKIKFVTLPVNLAFDNDGHLALSLQSIFKRSSDFEKVSIAQKTAMDRYCEDPEVVRVATTLQRKRAETLHQPIKYPSPQADLRLVAEQSRGPGYGVKRLPGASLWIHAQPQI